MSDVSVADWQSQTHAKLLQFFRCGDMVFLRGGIPFKHSSFCNKKCYITLSIHSLISIY